ncbi:TniB family NTP-binding protein [Methylosinus sp. PW1]|uniref:TniB family NTP-binding protein n=1 Tax=Methylosinus sp. PW1 TaxID=107636 RepID=UPI00056CA1E3|nr:TniB family NTP-binding protein [Methylosinus sp. PW1]
MTDASQRLNLLGTAAKSFLIEHPRLTEALERMDRLRAIGRKTIGKPQKILPIIGPSGSGKSTNIDAWRAKIVVKENIPAHNPHPVLHVTLSAKATVKSLGADILHALGENGLPIEVIADMLGRQRGRRARVADPMNDLKDAQIMYAAATALKIAGVQLLALDEIHHLVHTDGSIKTAWSVSETLKRLADAGVCPIAVIGTYEARRIISAKNNPQFAGRCTSPIKLDPLDISVPNELELFAGYVFALGGHYYDSGIFPQPQNLTREDFLACYYDVSKGVIGDVSRLTEAAAEYAIRRGSKTIDREDLSLATRHWAMSLDITDHDPWMLGARDLKTIKERT